MIRAHVPQRLRVTHPHRMRGMISVVHDPDGDFRGLSMSLYEFLCSMRYHAFTDGLRVKRGLGVYTVRGGCIYDAHGKNVTRMWSKNSDVLGVNIKDMQ